MHIRDWPASERPREKLLLQGADTLTESELLAVLLRHGHRGANALDLARSLLVEFGSLRALLSAGRGEVCRHRGIGPTRWAELQAALELARRHYLERLRQGPSLTSPRAAREFLVARLRDKDHEVFCCLYLDSRHRLMCFEELFRGTIDGASVHPREVVKQALEPSQADELITTRLRDALALVDIRVLDHLIVGDGTCTSLAERGLV